MSFAWRGAGGLLGSGGGSGVSFASSMSFRFNGLKDFSSGRANLAIHDFSLSLQAHGHLAFHALSGVETSLQLAQQLPILIRHFVIRKELKHRLAVLLTFTHVSGFRDAGLIAPG